MNTQREVGIMQAGSNLTTRATHIGLVCVLLVFGFTLNVTNVTAQAWQPIGPSPRSSHSAVEDPTTSSVVVFGGLRTETNGGLLDLNDTWRLNANLTWTALHPKGPLPTARQGHTAVYDSTNNRMIVFAGGEGFDSPCANDIWVLENANGHGGTPAWTQLSPSGSLPPARVLHGAAYDPNTNSMIVYGGSDCFSITYGDLWVLSTANGLGGTPTWTQLSTVGGGPGIREIQGGVAYDSANNRLIVFGGITTNGAVNNDVWVLSNANGHGGTPTWTQLSPTGTLPPARAQNSTNYDPTTNTLIIFGGAGNSGILQDSWVLSNANGLGGTPTWTQLSLSSLFPVGRYGHTGVYNPTTNKMTIYGGVAFDTGTLPIIANDTWVLNHANGK